jgi:cell division protein FtsB
MENENPEDLENLSVKDQLILSTFLAATLVGFGFIARIGWDLAGETKQSLKERKARKSEKQSS